METIGDRLKRLREENNFSFSELAKKIGVPETTYREWEKGRGIRGEPYIRIARSLNVSLATLLGADNEAESVEILRWAREDVAIVEKRLSK